MSRKFFDALRTFEERLMGMSSRTSLRLREEWMGTPETDRQRCIDGLNALATVWDQAPEDLTQLQALTKRCVELYATGEKDAGDFAVRDIDEFLAGVRERAASKK